KENFAHLLTFSTADYVMFCDQDDVWLPNKIEKTYLLMTEVERKHPNCACLIHTDLQVVNDKLHVIHPSMFSYQCLPKRFYRPKQALVQNNVTGCTMMLNKAALVVSLPISNSAIMHDWWIAAKVTLSQGQVVFLDEATMLYRQHNHNTIGSTRVGFYYYIKRMFHLVNVFSSYKAIICQSKSLGFDCAYCLVWIKLEMLVKRIFCVN
ncbi:MAG: hypothetical protein K0U21_00190, partial [Proteobacteria bacterium]|nr:hypothetical protein [Pseudomonadota bacterium]